MKTTLLKLSCFVFALLITAGFIGCSKSDPNPQIIKPICRISKITSTASELYTITYNPSGSINTVTSPDYQIKYYYEGNTIKRLWTVFSDNSVYKDSISVNNEGLYTNMFYANNDGTNWSNSAYEFNAGLPVKVTFTESSGAPAYSTTFVWNNGNYVKGISSDSQLGDVLLDYYPDKPAQQGDYLSYRALVSGDYVYPNKNSLKRLTIDPSTVENFEYTYDNDNKIITMKFITSVSDTITYSYEYQCN
jgi:hypothetical protein